MLSWVSFTILLSHLCGPCYLQGLLPPDSDPDYANLASDDTTRSLTLYENEDQLPDYSMYRNDDPGDTDVYPDPSSPYIEMSRDPFAGLDLALESNNSEERERTPPWFPYLWDKATQSAGDFLLGFCPTHCTYTDPIDSAVHLTCFNADCFPCECNETENMFCGIGSCCPTGQEVGDASLVKVGEHAGCLQQENTYYVLIGCPANIVNQSLREACENGEGELTLDEPVTDRDTMVTYRNQDCAKCHGVRSFQHWPLSISCTHFQYLYHAKSEAELLLLIRQVGDGSSCNVSRDHPPDVPVVRCTDAFSIGMSRDNVLPSPQQYNVSLTHKPIIAACNVTGLWADFDADVQAGCHRFTGLSFRVLVNKTQLYTNLFCAMCNGFHPEWNQCLEDDFDFDLYPAFALNPLTFLIGTQNRREHVTHLGEEACTGVHGLVFDNVLAECRNVSCPAGKSLNETSGTCTTAVKMIRGLVYELDIILVPKKSLRVTVPWFPNYEFVSFMQNTLVEALNVKTSGLLERYDLTFVVYTKNVTRPDVSGSGVVTVEIEIERLKISANMTSTITKERDEIEERLVSNLLLQDWSLFIEMTLETVHFTPSSIHHGLFGIRYIIQNHTAPVHVRVNSLETIRPHVHFQPEDRIRLTRLLTCPWVEFNSTEFLIKPDTVEDDYLEENPSVTQETESSIASLPSMLEEDESPWPGAVKVTGQWKVVLMGRQVSLLHSQFSWEIRQDGSFVICLDTLQKLLARHRSGPFWQYVLSMAAIPLSILCLLVLLLVYTFLSELRTQPGLNTMATCTSLLVAQLSLLLAVHRVVSGAWCTALGVLVHLSWLSAFCWTSVCSVHMYRAFSCTLDPRCGPGSYTVLAKSGAVTLLLPGAVVAVVVGVSWQQSAGQSIGYSSAACYLQSPFVVGLSVVLPLSLIVAFNLVLYSLTVYRIRKVIKLQARAESEILSDGQHVRACFRLSLLTGVTWLFSLLSESLDLDWLRAFSILANGGQGVLLLLSCVTTKLVVDKMMTRMGYGDEVNRGGSTGNSSAGLTENSEVTGGRMRVERMPTVSGPDL